jgi:hypothetical protein
MPSARREINPGRLDGSSYRCEHPAAMTRTLIKNGTILTVDPRLGDPATCSSKTTARRGRLPPGAAEIDAGG